MASKQAYQQKLEAQLKEWDAHLENLRAKSGQVSADARISFENEMEKLKLRREAAYVRLDELAKRGEDAWEDTKEGTEKVWAEMGKAMERIVASFK